jgi:hypothetical protein
MNMDVAAVFLASSILAMLGLIVWFVAVIIINNLLHRYWKPFNLYKIIDPNSEYTNRNVKDKQ